MDPAVFEPQDGSEATPAPQGELILRTGRHSGTRRPLNAPLTLLGRAPGCDVRLNVETVQPLHCALLVSPAGLILRDLNTAEGTLVNGQRVATCLLRAGDIIQAGPFEFEVALPSPVIEDFPSVPRPGEFDALRVQAAAVVAQQAALTEQEARLCQDRGALERQQEQLASHLEERRRQLLDLQEQVRQERADLQGEQAAVQELQQKARAERKAMQQELEQEVHAARKERKRLVELRKRLRRRWKRHWAGHEQTLTRREQDLHAEAERLTRARDSFDQTRLRLNGELELARREFEEERTGFRALQERWADYLQHERSALTESWRQVEARSLELTDRERHFQGEQRLAEETTSRLAREAAGLEARVEHLRGRLNELTTAQGWWIVGGLSAAPPAPAPSDPLTSVSGEQGEPLEALAGALADQRRHLAEQWEAFLKAQQTWADDHQALLPELEATALALDERARSLRLRELQLEREWAGLHQQHQVQTAWQTQLQGWQARLKLQEAAWADDRDAFLDRIRQREAVIERRSGILDRLRSRWAARRRQEHASLEEQWQRCQETQRQYLSLWEECERRRQELHETQRSLAERGLALQQLQIEVVGRSGDSVSAEKRLERLRKQWTGLKSQSEKALAQHRRTMQDEVARLQAAALRISQQARTLLQREDELAGEELGAEQEQAAAEDTVVRQQEEIDRLHSLRERSDQRIRELRDEVERLVRLLLDETTTPSAAA